MSYLGHRVVMSGGAGAVRKRAACPDLVATPAQPSLPPAPLTQLRRPQLRGNATERSESDLGAYIAKMIDDAPPLTSEQRDKLALILHGQHRR